MSHRFKMAGKEEVKLSVVFGENVTQLFKDLCYFVSNQFIVYKSNMHSAVE